MSKKRFCAKLLSIALAILLVAVWAAPVVAANAPDVEWQKTFGGSYPVCTYSVQQTSDGGYIATGFKQSTSADNSANFYLVKIDTQGNLQWEKTFGGSYRDEAHSVWQTSDGGYVVAGVRDLYVSNGAYLAKTDAQGNLQWEKKFNEYPSFAYSVQQTSDGGYIVAGYATPTAGNDDVYLLKTDASGNKAWSKTFGGSGTDRAFFVQQTQDGGYIVAGTTTSYGAGGVDVYLLKTDANGNEVWSKTFGGSNNDYAYSVQQTSDGGYVLAGYTGSNSLGFKVYLVKIDTQGNLQWEKTFGINGGNYAYSVQQTSDGGYILAGYTYSGSSTGFDAYLIKTDASGNEEWSKVVAVGGSGNYTDMLYCVQQTIDGGYIAAGQTYFPSGVSGAYLIKIAPGAVPILQNISVQPASANLIIGQTQQLAVTAYMSDGSTLDVTNSANYSTANSSIANVSSGGLITANGAGTTNITVSYQGKTATVPVLVSIPVVIVQDLTIQPNPIALAVGDSQPLTVTAYKSDGTTENVTGIATYQVSDPSVVQVSNGTVTALAAGSATITATYEGKTASSVVTVQGSSSSGSGGTSTVTIPERPASGGATVISPPQRPGTPSGGQRVISNPTLATPVVRNASYTSVPVSSVTRQLGESIVPVAGTASRNGNYTTIPVSTKAR